MNAYPENLKKRKNGLSCERSADQWRVKQSCREKGKDCLVVFTRLKGYKKV